MGEKVMRFSDLSGQLAEHPEELVGVLVTLHPDLDHPVRLEALPQELEQLGKHAIAAVGLEVIRPGDESPSRYVLTVSNFNKLATHRPMAEVLAGAEPVTQRRRSHNKTTNGEALRSFDTVESAGTPHKGKVSPHEAQLVREHLDEVNERLAAQGQRTINPEDPEHAKRYGFGIAAAGS
jgi:hypothetical protein